MITNPEIERLTKERKSYQQQIVFIDAQLQRLRREERDRIREAKKLEGATKKQLVWQDQAAVRTEMKRLRLELSEALEKLEFDKDKIEEIVGVRTQQLRQDRLYMERLKRAMERKQ